MATGEPRSAVLYLRLSDARNENGSFVDREHKLRRFTEARGWSVARVVTENDAGPDGRPKPASAYKRRKVRVPGSDQPQLRVIRPGFRSIVDDLTAGRVGALVAEDLDRVARDPRDLEDLVDAVRSTKAYAAALSGSLSFTAGGTDAEILQARVLVAVAAKSSADTARRVSDSRERRARAGQFGGGKRPYGFEPDGVTVRPAEAQVIADASRALVQGASLRGLARDLRTSGVPTATGAEWSAETLREILIRPRNAGLSEWKGQTFPAPWCPLVEVPVFERVVAILTDPERGTGPGRPPRWLGSGIYLCGVCLDGSTCKVTSAGRHPRYHCREGRHLTRHALRVDEVVSAFVIEYLAVHGAGLLVPDRPEVDVAALRTERRAIAANLDGIGADVVLGRLTRGAGHKATEVGRVRIAEIDAQLSSATVDDPLAAWVSAVDPAAVWDAAALEERRQLVRRLLVVTLLPVGPGGRFRPESVRVEPSTSLSRQ